MAHDDFTPIEAKALPLRKSGRIWAATHAILGLAWLALACWVIPKCEAIFLDFGAPLPAMSVALIKASHCAIKYFYVLVPLSVALIWLDLVVVDRFSAGEHGPERVRLWGLALTLLLVALLVGSFGAMILPMVTLPRNLSG